MLNQFILVGRIKSLEEGKITLNVPRSYKNDEGTYETDVISIIMKGTLDENTREYCKINDVIGINGNITCLDNNLELIAKKLTFLSSGETGEYKNEE